MPIYFCIHCGKETLHLNIAAAAAAAQVTRTTVYSWIRRHLVHCVHRPSGRRFVCSDSLVVDDEYNGTSAGDGAAVDPSPVRPR